LSANVTVPALVKFHNPEISVGEVGVGGGTSFAPPPPPPQEVNVNPKKGTIVKRKRTKAIKRRLIMVSLLSLFRE
jgi:hypothetical protein